MRAYQSECACTASPVEFQREFARRVRAVEKLKTAQRGSQAELDALFASLQHRAFRLSASLSPNYS